MLRFTLARAGFRSQLRPPLSVPRTTRGIFSSRPRADLDWHADGSKVTKIGKEEGRFHFTMVLLTLMPFVCTGLGIWQVNRLQWKLNLIEDLKDKLQRAPMMLPRNVNLVELPKFEYRRVQVSGIWDHAHTILLGPKTRDNVKGYNIITPLVRFDDASTVLVNRGFVSAEQCKNIGVLAKERGPVQLEGLLRVSQIRNSFTPDNVPEKGEWYWADVDALAEHAGGLQRGVQPVYIEATFNGDIVEASQLLAAGEPIGRSADIELRNMHLTYAITWFSLGAVTGGLLYHMIRQRRAAVRAQLKAWGWTIDFKRIGNEPPPSSSTPSS